MKIARCPPRVGPAAVILPRAKDIAYLMKNMNRSALTAFALLCVNGATQAQSLFFPNNVTINSNLTGTAFVGYGSLTDYQNKINGSSPTFNLSGGAQISSSVYVLNSSVANISGVIGKDLYSTNNSVVNIQGGFVVGYAYTYVNSVLNINQGILAKNVEAFANSAVNITYSQVDGLLIAHNNSRIDVNGGAIGGVAALDNGLADIQDGIFDRGVSAIGNSVVNISGGTYDPSGNNGLDFRVDGNATINFYGKDFIVKPVKSPFPNSSEYTLAGRFANGSVLRNNLLIVQNGSNAKVTINGIVVVDASVPEPGSVALFVSIMVTGGIMARRRIKRS